LAHNTQKAFIKFDDIKSSLCGWARIISYQTTTGGSRDPTHKRLEAVYEGHFEAGMKSGYVRGISAVDGSCSAGMHENDVVNGKFICFKNTGETARKEGFYDGAKLKQEIVIQNFYQSSNQHQIKMKK
jgi:hypothetical protein